MIEQPALAIGKIGPNAIELAEALGPGRAREAIAQAVAAHLADTRREVWARRRAAVRAELDWLDRGLDRLLAAQGVK